jgi:hypothetical protein
MKKFLISESEKQRILGMHKRAIRKEWVINEDVDTDNEKITFQKLPDAIEFKKILEKAEKAEDFTPKYYFGKKAVFRAVRSGQEDYFRWKVYVRTFCLKKYDDGVTYVDFLSPIDGEELLLRYSTMGGRSVMYSLDTASLPANDGVVYGTLQLGPYSNPATSISSNFANMGELELQNMVTSIPSLVTRIEKLRTQVPDVIKKMTGGAKRVYDYAGKTVDIDAVRKSEEEAAAEREKSAAASAQAEKDKAAAAAKEKADMDARTAAHQKAKAEHDAPYNMAVEKFATSFNQLFKELTDLVEGTAESNYAMGSQQNIEDKINQLQTLWSDPNSKGKSEAKSLDQNDPDSISKALKFIPKLIQTAKTKYPSMTATFVAS